ncbi:hypothetical protein ACHAXT_004238 [Thalassiosira profunda]
MSAASDSAPFDGAPFRRLMWDDAATTANDKERWARERISTPHLQGGGAVGSENNGAAVANVAANTDMSTRDVSEDDITPLDTFAGANPNNRNRPPPVRLWGLTQAHGGPCGVLAALQAEMIRVLLFGRGGGRRDLFFPYLPATEENYQNCGAAPITAPEVDEATAMAAGMILARAGRVPCAAGDENGAGNNSVEGNAVRLVLPTAGSGGSDQSTEEGKESGETAPWMAELLGTATLGSASSGLEVHIIRMPSESAMDVDDHSSPATKRPRNYSVSSVAAALSVEQRKIAALAGAVAEFLLTKQNADAATAGRPLDHLRQPGGVMLLVASLVSTRTVDRVRRDMDDPSSTLTSHFGHSSQELMNLLLTGQAVSNVFDNSVVLSEEVTCWGIQRRPAVGYLSALESLRYCEVGNYYKCPLFPIWVVGSTSHFSVVFGDERCLKESKSDILLERCRRAFKKSDGDEKLGDVMDELDLRAKVGGDAGVQTLSAYLEVSGAGIILWNDFWKATSRIITGSSLQSIMSGDDDAMQVDNNSTDGPPLLLTQSGEDSKPPAAATAMAQSDEELARKLAEEWGSPNPEHAGQSSAKSDEDLARELQAQWNAGNSGGMDVVDLRSVSSRPPTPVPTDADLAAKMSAEEAAGSQPQSNRQQLDFEKHGDSFPLYHYNVSASEALPLRLPFLLYALNPFVAIVKGLYGGTLTPFRLTRLSATEAVGASIALSKSASGHGGGGGDLEDVVRTKWPSSMINWLGKQAPSID